MKKITCTRIAALAALALMLTLALVLPLSALAGGAAAEAPAGPIVPAAAVDLPAGPIVPAAIADLPGVNVGEPLTWAYLATIAGAAAFTLLIVQFFKVPLDRVWRIPTRVFAYMVALAIMLVATAFTTGLTMDSALLTAVNALIAALTAYGAYEVTFGRAPKPKE